MKVKENETSTEQPDTALFEVAIIGGGPAGAATAIALAKLGVEPVFLADAGNRHRPKIGESIPPDTRDLFSRLGLLEAFLAEQHESCHGSHSSWGSDHLGYNDYLFNPNGSGWHLERNRFDSFMLQQAKQHIHILKTDSGFRSLHVEPQSRTPFTLEFEDGCKIKSRFIVDASGQAATLARKLGARQQQQDLMMSFAGYYPLTEAQQAQQNKLTLLEATEMGWWYCARLPGQQLVVSFTTDVKIGSELQLKNKENWLIQLQQTRYISDRVRQLPAPQQLHFWKTPSQITSPPAASGWLAVGDAASCFDPISAQGIYKALAGGLSAAEAISEWFKGNPERLKQYRETIAEDFIQYLQQRDYFYRQETRWPDAGFWQNRRNK